MLRSTRTSATAAEARRLGAAPIALSPELQFAIELAYFAGLTHDRSAELTGVPFGTVERRVRLGLRSLRHVLQVRAPSSPETPPVQMQAATLTGVGLLFLYAGRFLERRALTGRWSHILQFAPALAALAVTASGAMIVARALLELR